MPFQMQYVWMSQDIRDYACNRTNVVMLTRWEKDKYKPNLNIAIMSIWILNPIWNFWMGMKNENTIQFCFFLFCFFSFIDVISFKNF